LSHKSIVKYMRRECGAVFQEYIDGLSLQQMLDGKDERLKSPEFIREVGRQLLDATEYLHRNGVIHNDIKPDNVMITRVGNRVKLVDLGCAYSNMWDTTQGYTESYKAPEQGQYLTNVYTDIFLVGKLMEHLAGYAGILDEWKVFVRKATSRNWKERYDSDREALAAIPSKRYRRGKGRKIGGIIVGGMMVCVIFITILYIIGSTAIDNETDSIKNSENSPVIEINIDTLKSLSFFDADVDEGKALVEQAINETKEERYKEIKTKISTFTANEFKKHVFPKCKVYAKMQEGPEKEKYGDQIESIVKSIIDRVLKVAVEAARPYEENEYYYYAIACTKASMQEQYKIAIKYSDLEEHPKEN
ncbi:MAG: protein kinase, partial [Muribaculaceae bacterium]|nr:protein kinase [Muribaculaceae bacterium]